MRTKFPQSEKKIPFHNVRNISSPEDIECNRKVYVGQTTITSITNLPTNENVRDYLLEAEGKIRRRPTQVHRAIHDTLENNPENFSVLNSGVVIVARDCVIDEKEKALFLTKPSIINGSQTQGVIKDYLKELGTVGFNGSQEPHVKFEIIVTTDEELIAEISIARNFQNDVMTLSIAGRLGQLDELEKALQKKLPDFKLQKSETKLSDDYIKTERLIQVIAALVPEELYCKPGEFNKVYTYSMKTKCLKEFQEIYKRAHDKNDPDHKENKALYEFYLDIAAQALQLYEKWKAHQGFYGTQLRALTREDGKIMDVPDGIIFPIIASLSAFARKGVNGWEIEQPALLSDEELIRTAKAAYMEIAKSNSQTMGKTKACYSALYQITSIYKKLLK